LDDENWDSGVFGYGQFNYGISFLIRATVGLQTGLKSSKSGNFCQLCENWDLGVFEYAEFKYEIRFMIRIASGLQTGSKNVQK
jgi:hypothetical protein